MPPEREALRSTRADFVRIDANDPIGGPSTGEDVFWALTTHTPVGVFVSSATGACEYVRAAFDNAPIGMSLVSLDGRFSRVNASLCAITGYAEADLLARTFAELTHP